MPRNSSGSPKRSPDTLFQLLVNYSMERHAQHPKKEIDVTGLPEEAIRAVQSVVSLVRGQPGHKGPAAEESTDALLGLFRDEPELLDQIVVEAMSARETQPPRLPPD